MTTSTKPSHGQTCPHAPRARAAWPLRAFSLALLVGLLLAAVPVHATPVVTPDGLVLETFHLDNADLEVLASQIRPLLSPRGLVVVDARSMSLIVKDEPEGIGKVRMFLQRTSGSSDMVTLFMALVERVVRNEPNQVHSGGLVPSGGEGLLPIASRVPPSVVNFFNAYALERTLIPSGVTFKDVTLAVAVVPRIMEGGEVELTAYPRIAYTTPQGSGVIRVTECSATARVATGRTATMAIARSDNHGVVAQFIAAGGFKDQEKISFIVAPVIRKPETLKPKPSVPF